jgi:acyl dehydratase/NAD(P)-dependent dehydrogenase (short-subunit alcohol dehydrogenase family)
MLASPSQEALCEPAISNATLASRTFGEDDQAAFAALSGDFNPVHMDPIAARRTQAGAVVVHGVHGALWALDKLIELGVVVGNIRSVAAQFRKFVYLGDEVDLKVLSRTETAVVAELAVGTLTVTTLSVGLGTDTPIDDIAADGAAPFAIGTKEPADIERIEDLARLAGCFDVAIPSRKIERLFPHAVSALGSDRTAAIALLSALVGMVCPGRHSLFAAFAVELVDTPRARNILSFRVGETDDRFRLVRMNVAGAGVRGTVQAFMRWPSVAQAAIGDIAQMVSPSEFAGSRALIIGGSRGLGALTAKVVAAGGGEVIVTYAQGRDDAVQLSEEIRAHVGRDVCRTAHFDARKNAAVQLACIGRDVTHLYYFATTPIAKQKLQPFAADVLDEFMGIYVKGFYECCQFIAGRTAGRVTAFYPSSVFVEDGPPSMIEYAMAKAAGEKLCENLNRSTSRIRTVVTRLPRLLTDQTATVPPVATRDPLEVMLPTIRQVQASQ